MDEKTIHMLIGKALTIEHVNPYLDSLYNRCSGLDYFRFAYALAQKMQPDIIVELGTSYGHCTAHFAAGAPFARVVSIDRDDCTRLDLFAHDMLERYPNIELFRSYSNNPETTALYADESIGICFADTTHTYEHVLSEIKVWTPKMEKGGVWLIDDLREMPDLLSMLPFEVKGTIMGLHTYISYPDQRFSYAIVD